jgi:hypothetical protein
MAVLNIFRLILDGPVNLMDVCTLRNHRDPSLPPDPKPLFTDSVTLENVILRMRKGKRDFSRREIPGNSKRFP